MKKIILLFLVSISLIGQVKRTTQLPETTSAAQTDMFRITRPSTNKDYKILVSNFTESDSVRVAGYADSSGYSDISGNALVNTDSITAHTTAIGLNTTHRTSNGTDHTYIDQDVRTTSSPTFVTVNGDLNGNAGTVTNGVYTNTTNTFAGLNTFNSNPVILGSIGAPGTTTNRLYNVGGSLYWNGINLSSGSLGTVTSVGAGNGLNFSTITTTGNVTLGTPGSITSSSTNSVTATSHTHSLPNGAFTNVANTFTVDQAFDEDVLLADDKLLGLGFLDGHIEFDEQGITDEMVILFANVGINDITPSYTLDVDGDINFTGELRDDGTAVINQPVMTSSAVTFTTVNTGQGANELYDMNQNVTTTSAPTFATINTGQGANELYDMNQNVLTTSDVTFDDVTATGLINGVEVYVALISQNSTNNPSVTVIKNDIGAIVWTRSSQGVYLGTLVGAFTANKTVTFISQSNVLSGSLSITSNANIVEIRSYNHSGSLIDSAINGSSLRIEVYP